MCKSSVYGVSLKVQIHISYLPFWTVADFSLIIRYTQESDGHSLSQISIFRKFEQVFPSPQIRWTSSVTMTFLIQQIQTLHPRISKETLTELLGPLLMIFNTSHNTDTYQRTRRKLIGISVPPYTMLGSVSMKTYPTLSNHSNSVSNECQKNIMECLFSMYQRHAHTALSPCPAHDTWYGTFFQHLACAKQE